MYLNRFPFLLLPAYSLVNFGARFSTNAVMPSSRSLVEKVAWKWRRSKRSPSFSDISYAELTASLHRRTISGEKVEIFSPSFTASSTSLSAGTTLLTSPERSASSAVIMLPVRHISIAFDLPIARVVRWVPPAPGIVPSAISGCPNRALSPA
uniref:Uncharacterized protein n=1 Tax=Anopheles christyi TaxID=43041 RepID=A0A182KI76_9DIPT